MTLSVGLQVDTFSEHKYWWTSFSRSGSDAQGTNMFGNDYGRWIKVKKNGVNDIEFESWCEDSNGVFGSWGCTMDGRADQANYNISLFYGILSVAKERDFCLGGNALPWFRYNINAGSDRALITEGNTYVKLTCQTANPFQYRKGNTVGVAMVASLLNLGYCCDLVA